MSSAATTMVSFDGRQQLTVDFEPHYDVVVRRTSEVDDISLRLRTNHSSAHLLTSSSRHVTSDLLAVAISDGRISVDIRTATDHKVCTGLGPAITPPEHSSHRHCPSLRVLEREKRNDPIPNTNPDRRPNLSPD